MPSLSRSVPLLAQHDHADCLPACVEMVLASYQVGVSRRWLSEALEVTAIGTPGFKVLNLCRHGYEVTYASAVYEGPLVEALAANNPPIALVYTASLPYWPRETAHAVVVVDFGEQVILHDPAFAQSPQRVSREAFMLAWADFDYLYAVIRPR